VRSLHRSRPHAIAAVVVAAALGAVGFVPLFGGPGYEHAVASGVLVPSAAAIATALELSAPAAATSGQLPSPLAGVARGLASGLALAAVAFLTAVLHGIRVGFCDLAGGTILFCLTAGCGALLGGVWGALVAEATRGRRWRRLASVALALAAPLAGIATSIGRFYASPMIFAYDPFFGYFSGALYDTVVDARPELWTYRAGTAATLAGIALVAAASGRTPSGRADLRSAFASPRAASCIVAGAAALASSAAVFFAGPTLGHWQTAGTIAAALGGHASGPRCDVHYPEGLLAEQAALLVRDCEEELAADERRLGARLPGRLSAFEFADTEQKRRLMGAADTSIAKPWRQEVYIQVAPYPHPVLGHEIAHVVAGTFASGPFHVGGGIIPNPGLIEGIAVATSPDDGELTDAEWARAMLDLRILPSLVDLFSLDFFGQNASKSYTVAGAAIAWASERWGAASVRAWYGGASIEKLTGLSWSQLDQAFHAWLGEHPLPPSAMAYARARFERPSVWGRRCPHAVDALNRAGDQCRDDHRFDRAIQAYGAAIARDAQDWHALFDRARIELRFGDAARGRAALGALAIDEAAPRPWRDRAEEALADDDLLHDQGARAAGAYEAIAARTLDEDAARTLEVKALGAASEAGRRAIVDLLVGEPDRPIDPWLGALSLGAWAGGASRDADPLALYLVGKNLTGHEDFARAARYFDRALGATAPTPRIGRELLRARAVCACALRDRDALARVVALVGAPDSPFARGEGSGGGRREWLLRFIDRCGARDE
jgi:hypothetical protein